MDLAELAELLYKPFFCPTDEEIRACYDQASRASPLTTVGGAVVGLARQFEPQPRLRTTEEAIERFLRRRVGETSPPVFVFAPPVEIIRGWWVFEIENEVARLDPRAMQPYVWLLSQVLPGDPWLQYVIGLNRGRGYSLLSELTDPFYPPNPLDFDPSRPELFSHFDHLMKLRLITPNCEDTSLLLSSAAFPKALADQLAQELLDRSYLLSGRGGRVIFIHANDPDTENEREAIQESLDLYSPRQFSKWNRERNRKDHLRPYADIVIEYMAIMNETVAATAKVIDRLIPERDRGGDLKDRRASLERIVRETRRARGFPAGQPGRPRQPRKTG